MITRKGKLYLEKDDISVINGFMQSLEYPFKDAVIGNWTASGGQCAVYELDTKSGDDKKYVIKVSEESFERIAKFNDEFIDYCKELKKKNGEENISELYLKNERRFFVPGETSEDILYCIIEKNHLCLGNYKADGSNPYKNDMEIAIRLGADLLRLLDVMGNMKNPFVHRDIKPSNIFFKTGSLADGFCLGDFGIATQLLDGSLKTQIKDLGTVQTASPDIFLHDKYHSLFSGAKKADMYSLAVTMYYYLNDREYPFVDRKTSEGILDHQYWEDIRKKGCKEPKHGTAELKKIVCKALNFYPDNRYKSCAEMLEELKKTEEYKSFIESAEKEEKTIVVSDSSDIDDLDFDDSSDIDDLDFDDSLIMTNDDPFQGLNGKISVDSYEPLSDIGKYTYELFGKRYSLYKVIGTGNMTEVYKAYDITENKNVAVKVFEKDANKKLNLRFRNQSSVAKLYHYNIVEVYSVCRNNTFSYVVTEYFDGINLKDYLEQNKKPDFDFSVKVIAEVLRALQYAYGKGVVHGNISPQNIVISRDGNIKVADFIVQDSGNNEINHPNDVFSVCEILYEMLTGHKANIVGVISPGKLNSDVPKGLDQIVMRGLSRNKSSRYVSAKEMLDDIEAYMRNPAIVFQYKRTEEPPSKIKKEKRKKRKNERAALKSALGIAAASVILAVCALLFVKYPPEIIKDKYYEKAVSFAQSGDDVNAALYYGKAKDYKDAKEKSFALWDKITSVKTVSASYYHTVNINNDGTVSAVGYNGDFRCDVADWTDIVTVSAGTDHTVGLKSDGTVVAVGYNGSGQCDVTKWKDIVDISAGDYYTVGLKSDGKVVVTGGVDLLTDPISGAYFWSDIVAVSAGSDYAVGLKSDGTVVVSGSNDFDQHNAENWTHIISISSTRDHIAGLKSNGTVVAVGRKYDGQCDVSNWTDIVEVSAGYYHTVGLKSNGTVVAVGENEFGQCNVSDWTDIVAVSAGSYHTVGIKSDGTVVAVGKNDDGQCDVDNLRNRYFSDLQKNFSAMRTVSAGNYHTAGLKSDGTVFAVGTNENGQCDVNGWTDIVAVSSGGYHTLGLKSDGTVVAVGENNDGQCNNVSGWNGIVDISAGKIHSVGLKFDGTVVAVGNNEHGQCDVGDWKNIISVSAGRFHTVGLKSDGTVVAVGYNGYGQCDLSGWTDIIAVSAGDRHTVGLKSDGTVVVVGDNEFGQCNNLNSWTDIVAICAGHYHTLGLKSDGTVIAGGRNDYKQCDVAEWTDVVAVSAGAYHSAGLKSDGTVVAVGCNPDDGRCNTEGWKNIMLP